MSSKSARQALLTRVVSLGQAGTLRDIIEKSDWDVNETFSREPECYTAVFMAVEYGWAAGIRLLVQAGASVNTVLQTHECKFLGTCRSVTPLVAAIEGYQAECVRTLVACAADVTFQTPCDQTTPLYLAAHTNQPDVVRFLLELGTDTNVFTANENATPLAAALTNMAFRFDDAPRTPYTLVVQDYRRQEKALAIMEMLLQNGADMKLCQLGRLPPPFLCATQDDVRVMEMFLTYGLDVNMVAQPTGCDADTAGSTAVLWLSDGDDDKPDHSHGTWMFSDQRRILTYYLEARYYHVAAMLIAAGSDVKDNDLAIIKSHFQENRRPSVESQLSPSQEEAFYLEALYLYQCGVPSLKSVCRKSVRKAMKVTTRARVEELPVPKHLQLFLESHELCL